MVLTPVGTSPPGVTETIRRPSTRIVASGTGVSLSIVHASAWTIASDWADAGAAMASAIALASILMALLPRVPARSRRPDRCGVGRDPTPRSEEHTSELQSLMRISYAVFCLKKKINKHHHQHRTQ